MMKFEELKTYKEAISLQFIIISSVLIWGALYFKYGFTEKLVEYGILSMLLLIIGVIDYKTMEIPDTLNLLGGIVGLFFVTYHLIFLTESLSSHILGFLAGGGFFLLIAVLTNAMGGGDIKLMGVLGLWLGLKAIIIIAFLSFFISGIISLILILLKIKGRKDFIPFGPFISIAAFITLYTGAQFWEQHFALLYFLK